VKTSNELQQTDVNGKPVQEYVNLLIQKMTADDDVLSDYIEKTAYSASKVI